MARILLFARDPGGANVIAPLVNPLRAHRHEILLFGKDFALDRFRSQRFHPRRWPARSLKDRGAVERCLRRTRPDRVVTATSADDFTERLLWQEAGRLGIPSAAILDQWINYGIRFSSLTVAGASRFHGRTSVRYLPSRIFVMDDLARREAIAEGLPGKILTVCGHPYLSSLRDSAASGGGHRGKFSVSPNEMLIAFLSEPILEQYPLSRCNDYWGYDQKRIFLHLVRSLTAATIATGRRIALVVRPHPKEFLLQYKRLAADLVAAGSRVIVDRASPLAELLTSSNVVCGMSSMALLEAVARGVPIMSIQIGLRRADPFVLTRMGVARSLRSPDELSAALVKGLRRGRFLTCKFRPPPYSTARMIRIIEGMHA